MFDVSEIGTTGIATVRAFPLPALHYFFFAHTWVFPAMQLFLCYVSKLQPGHILDWYGQFDIPFSDLALLLFLGRH